jgi:hypothetical protein
MLDGVSETAECEIEMRNCRGSLKNLYQHPGKVEETKMICPKAKECPSKGCGANRSHKQEEACHGGSGDGLHFDCPPCIPMISP